MEVFSRVASKNYRAIGQKLNFPGVLHLSFSRSTVWNVRGRMNFVLVLAALGARTNFSVCCEVCCFSAFLSQLFLSFISFFTTETETSSFCLEPLQDSDALVFAPVRLFTSGADKSRCVFKSWGFSRYYISHVISQTADLWLIPRSSTDDQTVSGS